MSKKYFIISIIVLGVVSLCAFAYHQLKSNTVMPSEPEKIGSFPSQAIVLDRWTHGNTTTQSSNLPVKIFDQNRNRQAALVCNDSDTAIYIYLRNFSDAQAASTTVGTDGIRLNASGGCYEILPENFYIGEVWASSTLTGKKILFASSTNP